jgi:hypothetical protein
MLLLEYCECEPKKRRLPGWLVRVPSPTITCVTVCHQLAVASAPALVGGPGLQRPADDGAAVGGSGGRQVHAVVGEAERGGARQRRREPRQEVVLRIERGHAPREHAPRHGGGHLPGHPVVVDVKAPRRRQRLGHLPGDGVVAHVDDGPGGAGGDGERAREVVPGHEQRRRARQREHLRGDGAGEGVHGEVEEGQVGGAGREHAVEGASHRVAGDGEVPERGRQRRERAGEGVPAEVDVEELGRGEAGGDLPGETAVVGEHEHFEAGRGREQQARRDGALEAVVSEVERVQIRQAGQRVRDLAREPVAGEGEEAEAAEARADAGGDGALHLARVQHEVGQRGEGRERGRQRARQARGVGEARAEREHRHAEQRRVGVVRGAHDARVCARAERVVVPRVEEAGAVQGRADVAERRRVELVESCCHRRLRVRPGRAEEEQDEEDEEGRQRHVWCSLAGRCWETGTWPRPREGSFVIHS